MAATTARRNTPVRPLTRLTVPIAANVKINQGAMVSIDSSGYARPARTSTTDSCVGVAEATVDNTGGSAAAFNVNIQKHMLDGLSAWKFGNSSAGDLIATKDIGSTCYVVDDQTVALTNGTNTRIAAGRIVDVDSDGVWVLFN